MPKFIRIFDLIVDIDNIASIGKRPRTDAMARDNQRNKWALVLEEKRGIGGKWHGSEKWVDDTLDDIELMLKDHGFPVVSYREKRKEKGELEWDAALSRLEALKDQAFTEGEGK